MKWRQCTPSEGRPKALSHGTVLRCGIWRRGASSLAVTGKPIGQRLELVLWSGLAEDFQPGLAQLRAAERARPDDAATLKAKPCFAEEDADNLSLMQGLARHHPQTVVGKVNDSPSRFFAAFRWAFPHGDGQGLRNPGRTAAKTKFTLHERRHRFFPDYADPRNIPRSCSPVKRNFQ